MASNNPNEPSSDDFLDQILGFPTFTTGLAAVADGGGFAETNGAPASMMMLQLSSGDGSGHMAPMDATGGGAGSFPQPVFPLGLSLEQGKRGDAVDRRPSSFKNVFHGQPMPTPVPAALHPPVMRPRVRARRGQATDPHSIAERLRRERIAERIRALQELVPTVNKTDRAVMLDEVVDYVKFLRLQVKVLSMSRLGGAGAVAPLVTDVPLSSAEDETGEGGRTEQAWERWSSDGTEKRVATLMEENVGAAMQLLQSKALCIMPISLATAIYHAQPPDASSLINPETNTPP